VEIWKRKPQSRKGRKGTVIFPESLRGGFRERAFHKTWKFGHSLEPNHCTIPKFAIKTLSEMKQRLRELDEEIKETKRRLPAHSVKPPVMMDLLALEDEYDLLLKEIQKRKARESG